MRWLVPEQVMHTCNLECGHVYRVCIGIMSQNMELCHLFYKLLSLSRIYMLILRNVHWISVSLICLMNKTNVLHVWLFNKCSHFGVSYSHSHYVFIFIAANLKPLTIKFFTHRHNSSTVPLSTPTLWSTPSPIHSCSPIPTLGNFKSEVQVSMLFRYNVIIRHNITRTTIISQFDLCCTVTCLRHYTHISRL